MHITLRIAPTHHLLARQVAEYLKDTYGEVCRVNPGVQLSIVVHRPEDVVEIEHVLKAYEIQFTRED